jgi:uncharacterized membrane protein
MIEINKLLQIADQKRDFNAIAAFDKGFRETISDFTNYVGFTVLSLAIQIGVGFLPIINVIIALISGLPLQLAHAHFVNKKLKGEKLVFNSFFDTFQKVVPLLVYNIVLVASSLALLFPLILIAAIFGIEVGSEQTLEDLNLSTTQLAAFGISTILFFLLFIYLAVSIILAPYFVYFYNIPAFDALKLSFKFTHKRWFKFLGFYLLSGLVVLAGFMCFMVGIAVAIPVVRIAYYYLFEQVTGLRDEEA